MPKKTIRKTQKQLVAENSYLRARLEESEEILRAVRSGEADALIISGVNGEQVLTLKQAEEQIRHQAVMLESVKDAIVASDAQGRLTVWSAAAESLYGWKAEEVLGRNGVEIIGTQWPEMDAEIMRQTLADTGRWHGEATEQRKDGTQFPVEVSSLVLRDEGGKITGYISVNRDITERKQADIKLQRQLGHLIALSAIDRVVASNFDLELCLSEILTHVTTELDVDAADILILNPSSQMLDFGAERGFRSPAIRKTQLRLGTSYAGRVAAERQLLQIPNLKEEPVLLPLTTPLTGEDFICYIGVPLIT